MFKLQWWWEDQNDNENNSITITKNGVSIITDTVNGSNNDIKELKINKDGIIKKINHVENNHNDN
jgi:hypothetical protein